MPNAKQPDELPDGSFHYIARSRPRKWHDTVEDAETEIRRRIESGEIAKTSGLWELVNLYKSCERPDKIKSCVNEILGDNPDAETSATCHHAFGCLAEQERDYSEAISHYQKALAFHPCDTSIHYLIHNNLGYSLIQCGRYSEAAAMCRKAIEINPTRQNAYKNLGLALEGLGEFAEAARNYVRATKTNAADPRALALLEELYKKRPELETEIERFQDILDDCRSCVKACDDLRNSWS